MATLEKIIEDLSAIDEQQLAISFSIHSNV